MKLKKLWKRFWWGRRYVGELTLKEWWARHCPRIPNKFPKLGQCPYCGKPLKIHAYLVSSVDGYDMWIDCEDECAENGLRDERQGRELFGWWPFMWGAACNNEDLRKRGIITH